MKKVIISVTNDLVSDQRIDKVANTLLNNNYSVILVGRRFKTSLAVNRKYKTHRFMLFFKKGPFFYAEYNLRLFILLIFSKADIFLSNDLDTLPANFFASKIRQKKLVYDSHEYFTEVPELVNRKKVQKIWMKIEAFLLPKIKNSYTVCSSISEIYSKKYGIDMKVIRNLPVCVEADNEVERIEKRKIILYQGSLNIGRGIEYVIEAMQFIENAVFWIIGDGDIKKQLEKIVEKLSYKEKIAFFGKIPFENLKKYTLQADLGISIEENLGLNYYYALPNKIFDYIHCNVPVLVSPFPEMKRLVEHYQIGDFIDEHNSKSIADKINAIFKNEEKINFWKKNLYKSKNELCWQNEEKILIEVFKNIC